MQQDMQLDDFSFQGLLVRALQTVCLYKTNCMMAKKLEMFAG